MEPSSPLPWHTAHHVNSPGADLRDANGTIIGIFPDWRNAEYVLSLSQKLIDLEKELDSYVDKMESSLLDNQ